MNKLKSFAKISFLGGLVAVLPLAMVFLTFRALWNFTSGKVQPIANLIPPPFGIEWFADAIALAIIITLCFLLGMMIRTKLGRYYHRKIETIILVKFPLYKIFKEIILQFFGDKESPFSRVALARIFDNDTMVTCFITDSYDNGKVTVFVPTGPNPTSGNIYHLNKDQVIETNATVEEAMQSIISCGRGSAPIVNSIK